MGSAELKGLSAELHALAHMSFRPKGEIFK